MNRTPAESPQERAAAAAATEAALNAYADHVAADDFELPEDAVVDATTGEQPGRAFLEQFVDADELDRIARGGRPSLSGAGPSPKRQVRLPADIDAALAARAKAQGLSTSVIMRAAIEAYLNDDRPALSLLRRPSLAKTLDQEGYTAYR